MLMLKASKPNTDMFLKAFSVITNKPPIWQECFWWNLLQVYPILKFWEILNLPINKPHFVGLSGPVPGGRYLRDILVVEHIDVML